MMRILAAALILALGAVAGCRVDTHSEGKNKDVKIATPFGGMSVKTNANAVGEGVGLTVYPGSTLVKKDGDHDDGAADFNLSFGDIHFGVKAVSYQTGDNMDRVETFYRKDLARYGTVILCQGHASVGKPERTQDGLTCSDDGDSHVTVSEASKGRELKAGSRQHQHLVSLEQKDGGVEIGLIALDLPGRFTKSHGESEQ